MGHKSGRAQPEDKQTRCNIFSHGLQKPMVPWKETGEGLDEGPRDATKR